jgi:lipid-A-disaccharide synthase
MVVAYRLGALTALLLRRFGLMKAPFFAQPNLLAGRAVVPELFQEDVSPQRLAAELERWLDDADARTALVEVFTAIHQQLRRSASERAADAVLALVDQKRGQSPFPT